VTGRARSAREWTAEDAAELVVTYDPDGGQRFAMVDSPWGPLTVQGLGIVQEDTRYQGRPDRGEWRAHVRSLEGRGIVVNGITYGLSAGLGRTEVTEAELREAEAEYGRSSYWFRPDGSVRRWASFGGRPWSMWRLRNGGFSTDAARDAVMAWLRDVLGRWLETSEAWPLHRFGEDRRLYDAAEGVEAEIRTLEEDLAAARGRLDGRNWMLREWRSALRNAGDVCPFELPAARAFTRGEDDGGES